MKKGKDWHMVRLYWASTQTHDVLTSHEDISPLCEGRGTIFTIYEKKSKDACMMNKDIITLLLAQTT